MDKKIKHPLGAKLESERNVVEKHRIEMFFKSRGKTSYLVDRKSALWVFSNESVNAWMLVT